jgi:hypothetical protein
MLTLSLNREMRKVKGKIIPCHSPSQKPAREPSESGESLRTFGPVNKILHDIVAAVRPEWCVVRGEFTPRGGLSTSIFARWPSIAPHAKSNKGNPHRK